MIVGTLAGLAQDIFVPLFNTKVQINNNELISVVKQKKTALDISFSQLYKKLNSTSVDSSLSQNTRDEIDIYKKKLSEAKLYIDTLVINEINALQTGSQILAYEIHSQLHKVPKTHQLTFEVNDSVKGLNYKLKEIDSLANNFVNNIYGCSPHSVIFITKKRDSDIYKFSWDFGESKSIDTECIKIDSSSQIFQTNYR